MSKDEAIDQMCLQCKSRCCRYFCFEIDKPDSFEEFENLRWFILHEGITIHIDEGDWFMSVNNKCKWLADDGRCVNYENRPMICRSYTTENCDATGGDYEYDELFETADQIAEYARKTLGRKKYEKALAKLYGKSSAKTSPKEHRPDKPKKKDTGKAKDKVKGKKKAKGKDKAADSVKGR